MFFKQPAEVEDGGFIRDALQAQTGELAQDGRLIQGFFHGRSAVAEPFLHQMHPQHRHQRISRAATFSFVIVRLDQLDQACPRHHLIHLDQEALLTGLFAFNGVFGIGEGHLLHQAARRWRSGILPNLEDFFRDSLTSYLFDCVINAARVC